MLTVIHGKPNKIGIAGSLRDVTDEVLRVIATVHTTLLQQDPKMAHIFRMTVVGCVFDADSPIWNGQLSEGTTVTRISKDILTGGERQ